MYKKLLFLLVSLTPCTLFAQKEIKLVKDYATDVRNIYGPVALNDKIKITTINSDKDQFAVIANKEDLTPAWAATLSGFNVFCGVFKGKVLVVSEANGKDFRDQVAYTARLLDAVTGKVTLEKIIYNKNLVYEETPAFNVSADGENFKLTILESQTEHKRRFINYTTQAGINDITSILFDNNLNVVNTFHLVLKGGRFLGGYYDEAGNFYIAWHDKGTVTVSKYQNKAEPVSQVTEALEVPKNADPDFTFKPSINSPNIFYMAATYFKDKVCYLRLSKMDFSTKKSKFIDDTFNNGDLEALEKSFVPVNKKLDKPHDLESKWLQVSSITEQNGMFLVFLTSERLVTATGKYSTYTFSYISSSVISGYDLDLNHKYYQIMPSGFKCPYNGSGIASWSLGYKLKDNLLSVLTTYNDDGLLYGTMDVATGAWKNMVLLEKRKMGGSYLPRASNIFWYPNSLAIPYIEPRGMKRNFQNISLQSFSY